MKSNGFLAALFFFATSQLSLKPAEAIWDVPMAQLVLLLRQKQLEDCPDKAWTFSDEAFVMKVKALGY